MAGCETGFLCTLVISFCDTFEPRGHFRGRWNIWSSEWVKSWIGLLWMTETHVSTTCEVVIFRVKFTLTPIQDYTRSPWQSYISWLSLNRHLYKTDTSVKWTPGVRPYLSLLPLFDSLYDGHFSKREILCQPQRCQRVDSSLCLQRYIFLLFIGHNFQQAVIKLPPF